MRTQHRHPLVQVAAHGLTPGTQPDYAKMHAARALPASLRRCPGSASRRRRPHRRPGKRARVDTTGVWAAFAGCPDQQSPPPASTPAVVVSLLMHRVIGSLPRDTVPMVPDYHGLAGRPTGTLTAVAARHHITPPTVLTVRPAGAGRRGRALPARRPLRVSFAQVAADARWSAL